MQNNNSYLINQLSMVDSFNKAAQSYNQAAFIQREISHRLAERLDIFKMHPKVILDAGMGTGILTQQLIVKYPAATHYGIDIAYSMVNQAKQGLEIKTDSLFLCADAALLPFENASVDLIVSNLVIHWCNDLLLIFKEFQRILKPEGVLLFSTLGPDTLYELRASWATVDNYSHVNTFLDMHPIGDDLLEAQFNDPVMDREYITINYSSVGEIMRDLKKIGAHNVTGGRRQGLTGKSNFKRMMRAYDEYRNQEGLFPVTYEVIYGHALGSEISEKKSEFEIPLSAIKRK